MSTGTVSTYRHHRCDCMPATAEPEVQPGTNEKIPEVCARLFSIGLTRPAPAPDVCKSKLRSRRRWCKVIRRRRINRCIKAFHKDVPSELLVLQDSRASTHARAGCMHALTGPGRVMEWTFMRNIAGFPGWLLLISLGRGGVCGLRRKGAGRAESCGDTARGMLMRPEGACWGRGEGMHVSCPARRRW